MLSGEIAPKIIIIIIRLLEPEHFFLYLVLKHRNSHLFLKKFNFHYKS